MKKFVYPAIIFYDEDAKVYVLVIEDLSLVAEGDSVEDAHARGSVFLANYMHCALSEDDVTIPEPSDFDTIARKYPKQMCVLVEATLNDKNHPV